MKTVTGLNLEFRRLAAAVVAAAVAAGCMEDPNDTGQTAMAVEADAVADVGTAPDAADAPLGPCEVVFSRPRSSPSPSPPFVDETRPCTFSNGGPQFNFDRVGLALREAAAGKCVMPTPPMTCIFPDSRAPGVTLVCPSDLASSVPWYRNSWAWTWRLEGYSCVTRTTTASSSDPAGQAFMLHPCYRKDNRALTAGEREYSDRSMERQCGWSAGPAADAGSAADAG